MALSHAVRVDSGTRNLGPGIRSDLYADRTCWHVLHAMLMQIVHLCILCTLSRWLCMSSFSRYAHQKRYIHNAVSIHKLGKLPLSFSEPFWHFFNGYSGENGRTLKFWRWSSNFFLLFSRRFWPSRVLVRPKNEFHSRAFLHFCLFALSWLRTFSLSFLCACRQNVAVHENCIRPYMSKVDSVYALVCRFFNAHTDESALVH